MSVQGCPCYAPQACTLILPTIQATRACRPGDYHWMLSLFVLFNQSCVPPCPQPPLHFFIDPRSQDSPLEDKVQQVATAARTPWRTHASHRFILTRPPGWNAREARPLEQLGYWGPDLRGWVGPRTLVSEAEIQPCPTDSGLAT